MSNPGPPPSRVTTSVATFIARLRAVLAGALLNRYAGFLACLYLYSVTIPKIGGLGEDSVPLSYVETAVVLYLYYYFNTILRPSRVQALLAAIPIFLAYLGQDIYYMMYGRVFRIIELAEIPELLDILTPGLIALVIVVFLVPLLIFVFSVNYRRVFAIAGGSLPLLLMVAAVEFFPNSYATAFEKVGNEIVTWSDQRSVENNGRFAMLFYREAQRMTAKQMTIPFRARTAYDHTAREFADRIGSQRVNNNVHLIVMESLLDPTLFRGASFTTNPTHPDFARLFGNATGFSVSPVFGGATSQAEFEVLCGVPAFRELGSVEFNAFTGAQAWCLPGLLKLAGYRTIASNAFKPNFFNAVPAYRGIGFGEAHFPQEYTGTTDTYLSIGDVSNEYYMFDGTLFSQNLAFVENIVKDKQSPPILNYVLSIYGHLPHTLDNEKRPQVLTLIADHPDDQLERAANQYYYRTQAIAEYVNTLVDIDPHSLIILISDHLPPLQYGPNTYRDLRYLDNQENSRYLNRVLIIENGTAKHYPTIHHYDVPALVFNYLTAGTYCRENTCDFTQDRFIDNRAEYHTRYMSLMAHAAE
ncbi:MAG: sulfatase [Gammaproteobacteria bacterium]|nr:MAG: sulfatase [Gammaproteobacteria bacterium]TND04392.1 MAG: sulfatase [Gammaproteobacteria bacterium]